jgi:hypothetical protein
MGRKDTSVFYGKALPDVSPGLRRNGLLQSTLTPAVAAPYNAAMKKSVHSLVLLCFAATAFSVAAQAEPPPPPPGYPGYGYGNPGQMQRPLRDWRDASPDQREQWREERRQQRREAWREMSPEERHQLRRDIRDAGRFYRRGQRD